MVSFHILAGGTQLFRLSQVLFRPQVVRILRIHVVTEWLILKKEEDGASKLDITFLKIPDSKPINPLRGRDNLLSSKTKKMHSNWDGKKKEMNGTLQIPGLK